MEDLSIEHVMPLTPHARAVMLDLVLAWARYDALISQLLSIAYNLPLDGSSLIIGNMDTRTKLDRIKLIYEHHGMKTASASIDALRKKHLELVFARNHVAHSICGGLLKSDQNKVVFLPFKAVKGSLGNMAVYEVSLTDMQTARRFAKTIGDDLNAFNGKHTGQPSARPPEPPVFVLGRRPTPRKQAQTKRPSPPRSSEA